MRYEYAMAFTPNLDTLSASQRALWLELAATPEMFTLYGGTALALWLGHRTSVDFDFFSNASFDPDQLAQTIPYVRDAERVQVGRDTLTCRVDRGGPVLVSFFGRLGLGQVAAPEQVSGMRLHVALCEASWRKWNDAMKPLPKTPQLLAVAERVVWFKSPAEALANPVHFLAHVMTYGTVEDLRALNGVVGPNDFRETLDHAPPGVFDARSWAYWNLRCGRDAATPLPTRRGLESVRPGP